MSLAVSRFSQTPYAYRHLASRNTSFRSVDRNLMFRILAGGPHLYSVLLRDPPLTVTSNADRKENTAASYAYGIV